MLKHIVTVMGMLTILFGQFNIQGKGGYVPTQDNRSDCVSPQQRQEIALGSGSIDQGRAQDDRLHF